MWCRLDYRGTDLVSENTTIAWPGLRDAGKSGTLARHGRSVSIAIRLRKAQMRHNCVRETSADNAKQIVYNLRGVVYNGNDREIRLEVHTCGLRDLIPSMGSDP